MKLEKHVLYAIDDYQSGKTDSALMHACMSIDATARHLFNKDHITNRDYKKCLRDYYWIIEPMIGQGINLEETRFKNVALKEHNGKENLSPDLADIIYHIFRCLHAHSKPIPLNYELLPEQNGNSLWHFANDTLKMPERIIWALLAVSVFCKANKHIKSDTGHFLILGDHSEKYRFMIKDCGEKKKCFCPMRKNLIKYEFTYLNLIILKKITINRKKVIPLTKNNELLELKNIFMQHENLRFRELISPVEGPNVYWELMELFSF